jgi:enoyl-CoA hydratase
MAEPESTPVRSEHQGPVTLLTISHPPVNSISRGVAQGLLEGLGQAEADSSCRAVVLTGEGSRFFSAGADVTEFGRGEGETTASMEVTRRLEASRLPVVAAINGIAFGGGCEMALACDIRVAAEEARLGQPEVKLGIMPGWGGTQRLPRLIGPGRAMELLLTGDPIDAGEALRCGLVTRVVPAAQLAQEAMGLARLLAERPPLAIAAIKRSVRRGLEGSLEAGLRLESEEFARLFGTEDAREGVAAFLEKRQPAWKGR